MTAVSLVTFEEGGKEGPLLAEYTVEGVSYNPQVSSSSGSGDGGSSRSSSSSSSSGVVIVVVM